jgi:hypothetical protein
MMWFQPSKFEWKVNFSNAFWGRWHYKITFYQKSRTDNAEHQYNKRMIMTGLMRSFIFIVGLIILTAALVMAFEPPNNKEIHLAIGSTNDLPDSLQRA